MKSSRDENACKSKIVINNDDNDDEMEADECTTKEAAKKITYVTLDVSGGREQLI